MGAKDVRTWHYYLNPWVVDKEMEAGKLQF